jgi:CheY-like chemotaxis protein
MSKQSPKDTTILVIEDETVLRHLLVTKLKREGYNVLEAENGRAGLDVAINNEPDLTLLDIIMPTMNGVDMLKNLRQDGWGKTAHVILLTNLSDAEGIEEAKAYGVNDYLVKADWSLEELASQVKDKLKQ